MLRYNNCYRFTNFLGWGVHELVNLRRQRKMERKHFFFLRTVKQLFHVFHLVYSICITIILWARSSAGVHFLKWNFTNLYPLILPMRFYLLMSLTLLRSIQAKRDWVVWGMASDLQSCLLLDCWFKSNTKDTEVDSMLVELLLEIKITSREFGLKLLPRRPLVELSTVQRHE